VIAGLRRHSRQQVDISDSWYNLSWRETAAKIHVRYAGYVDPGPLRPPFVEIPTEVDEAAKRKADQWKALCDECRAEVAAAA